MKTSRWFSNLRPWKMSIAELELTMCDNFILLLRYICMRLLTSDFFIRQTLLAPDSYPKFIWNIDSNLPRYFIQNNFCIRRHAQSLSAYSAKTNNFFVCFLRRNKLDIWRFISFRELGEKAQFHFTYLVKAHSFILRFSAGEWLHSADLAKAPQLALLFVIKIFSSTACCSLFMEAI